MPGFSEAIERVWAGERDRLTLCAGLGARATRYIDSLLSHIGSGRDTSTWARARPSVEQEMASRGEEATDSSVSHHANSEAVQELVSFTGKSEEQVIMCLKLAEGDKGAAAAMLLES